MATQVPPSTTVNMNRTATDTLGSEERIMHRKGDGHLSRPKTVIFLNPIAAPTVLGLAGYASATFITATWLAEWYGNDETPRALWPFLLTFGGLAQFAAGMWAYKSRDTFATLMHTMWGAFYIAYSLYLASAAFGFVAFTGRYDYNSAWGIWMVPLSVLTYVLTASALFRDMIWSGLLFTLATGSLFGVLGWFISSEACVKIMAYMWIVSSVLALYRITSYIMREANPKKNLLPLYQHPSHRRRQGDDADHGAYDDPFGEPGVAHGYSYY
ncbi:GPR1/FUN34/yaaH family-domain-containing protein [Gaertneriomyces semiglobifer]|nr:GPR1/FUN34/yaaH family-domain-containing protein [Gaertneriomyces semiglobifer]